MDLQTGTMKGSWEPKKKEKELEARRRVGPNLGRNRATRLGSHGAFVPVFPKDICSHSHSFHPSSFPFPYTPSALAIMPYDPTSQSNLDEAKTNHIHLDLAVDFDAKILSGSAELEIEAIADAVTKVILDTSFIDIRSVSVGGQALSVKQKYTGYLCFLDFAWFPPLTPAPCIVHTLISQFKLQDRNEKYGSALVVELAKPLTKGEKIKLLVQYATTKDCTACQWLEPSQTVGKKHPYLFTQCQAIHARSLLPCQDSPSIKLTYSANITTPLRAVMSAVPIGEEVKQGSETTTFRFEQKTRIPSYLIALAVGNLEGREIGPRSTVWTEPEVLEAAAWEFVDTENFIRTGEELLTPYDWGRYDLLVLPASFPYGGMENPCLTFVTPSLLAGDRSLVDVVAHEIAHSWMGNLVTTENWEHFWLNEGFTVFVERKILGRMKGPAHSEFSAILGHKALKESVDLYGKDHPFTALRPCLRGEDPDDAFSKVPYGKRGCTQINCWCLFVLVPNIPLFFVSREGLQLVVLLGEAPGWCRRL